MAVGAPLVAAMLSRSAPETKYRRVRGREFHPCMGWSANGSVFKGGPIPCRVWDLCGDRPRFYEFDQAAVISEDTMGEFDEACPTATPALSPDEIEARRAEVLVVGELDDEPIGDLETAEYDEAGAPKPGRSLKQMLGDMASSGVWDVERDEIIEPRLIP
jgi:hypothetical protein